MTCNEIKSAIKLPSSHINKSLDLNKTKFIYYSGWLDISLFRRYFFIYKHTLATSTRQLYEIPLTNARSRERSPTPATSYRHAWEPRHSALSTCLSVRPSNFQIGGRRCSAALSVLSSRATAERDSNSEESSLASTSTIEWRRDSNLLSGTHHEQTQQFQVYA